MEFTYFICIFSCIKYCCIIYNKGLVLALPSLRSSSTPIYFTFHYPWLQQPHNMWKRFGTNFVKFMSRFCIGATMSIMSTAPMFESKCSMSKSANSSKRMTWYCQEITHQGKRVNPPYRPSTQGNPSWVIFQHGTQFFRGCYSRDVWKAQATIWLSDSIFICGLLHHCSYLFIFWGP